MAVALPLFSVAIGLVIGHWLGRSRQWVVFVLLMLAGAGLFVWAVLVMRAQAGTGLDEMIAAVLLVFGLIPLAIGGLAGAGIAGIRNRRDAP